MTAYVLREGTPESVGMDPARVRNLRALLAGWVKNGDTPSVVALVARRGVVVLHEAFGVRRHGDTTPTLRIDSIFPVASCAKPVTAAAILCLVEDGLLGLNRPFVDYVPELDVPDVQWIADAKIADLLSHTAGFDDFKLAAFTAEAARRKPELPAPAAGRNPRFDRWIRLAAGCPLAFEPGTKCLYSNFGYNVLGDIVRGISGQPFWQFVQSRLFEPLGMRDSYFVLPPALRERRVYRAPGAPTTERALAGGIDSPEFDEIDMGSFGLASTAEDLALFLQMLLNRGSYGGRQILSPASVAAMRRNQHDAMTPSIAPWTNQQTGEQTYMDIRAGGYGYGVATFGAGDRFQMNGSLMSLAAFGHIGIGGSSVWADPVHEVVGVFLSVSPRAHRGVYVTNCDLFQNAVHAAIVD